MFLNPAPLKYWVHVLLCQPLWLWEIDFLDVMSACECLWFLIFFFFCCIAPTWYIYIYIHTLAFPRFFFFFLFLQVLCTLSLYFSYSSYQVSLVASCCCTWVLLLFLSLMIQAAEHGKHACEGQGELQELRRSCLLAGCIPTPPVRACQQLLSLLTPTTW